MFSAEYQAEEPDLVIGISTYEFEPKVPNEIFLWNAYSALNALMKIGNKTENRNKTFQ
jgi:hypothetical protein